MSDRPPDPTDPAAVTHSEPARAALARRESEQGVVDQQAAVPGEETGDAAAAEPPTSARP